MQEVKPKRVVAYVPFTTFMSAIDALEHGRDIPHRLDTSVWPGYSTAIQSQLLGAFRFLGFIDDAGKPTSAFRTLVRERANRKAIMRRILESSYARIVGLGLTRISPRQFDAAMRQYGMSGETHKKVVSFFLRAAKYAELPISPLLGKKVRAGGLRRQNRMSNPAGQEVDPSAVEAQSASAPQPTSKTVRLRSGGNVTLNVEGSFLEMSTSDRLFVFELIDKLQEYEKGAPN